MKRKFSLLAILLASFFYGAFSQTSSGSLVEKNIGLSSFDHLIVKSNIRVVLFESEGIDSARIEGTKDFTGKIIIVQSGSSLVIRANSFKDLRKEGTVYIPVRLLRSIEVYDDAKIISYSIITSPQLDLLIEGSCTVSIILKGKLNIVRGEGYDYSFRRVAENSNTPAYQQSIFNY